ncbi:sigma-54 factor interaction domain-containing protein [Desulfurispirillum indicum S5]|uniref:DNA-binding transcriptional regulator NtrC n=1 Tax=Desulfurispirillum indicum (strain ATCC BAA-1389 / DSM 22839 / S5) TaxID=653733 RepID=E6W676_DESIS|nr:sigma-54 dependent transcriptional regulator [Desulfurispirillum indicum]ADU66112.1 sigma-54 factor interaction domain-containing protein [Desulfurispirillum indicum S5]
MTLTPKSVLIVDDEKNIQIVMRRALDAQFRVHVASNAAEALTMLENTPVDLVFMDINMPGMSGLEALEKIHALYGIPVIIMTARTSMQSVIDAMKLSAYDFVTKPFEISQIRELASQATSLQVGAFLRESTDGAPRRFEKIIGSSMAMREVFKLIGKVAPTRVTVLIEGESGTGKELVARVIHQNSLCADKPFIPVNLAAIPRELMESEFFGHEKGSFTGATDQRMGLFREAQGGTLFLDELGHMPLDLQAKLLRVLQEGEVSPVGSSRIYHVDVRIIAATNRNLLEMVKKNLFREDLYYRLNVFSLRLPPLRERMEDLKEILDYFIYRYSQEYRVPQKQPTPEALAKLRQYEWPGNVRELENVVRRALLLSNLPYLTPEDFPLTDGDGVPFNAPESSQTLHQMIRSTALPYLHQMMDHGTGNLHELIIGSAEKSLYEIVLEYTGGNQVSAASILGVNRNTVRKKIQDYDINMGMCRRKKE